MKTRRKHKTSNSGLIYLAGLVVLGLVVTFFVLRPKPTTAPTMTTNTVDPSTITIVTADNITLQGTIKYPAGTGPFPTVVLLHQYGKDRHEWDTYLQKFLDQDIAVLSYDMRGFGESRLAVIPKDQTTHLSSLVNDFPAVMAFLRQQPDIDLDRISLIGAGVGANVAFVAAGSNDQLFRTVLLTPIASPGNLDGTGIDNFYPKNILGVAGTTDIHTLQILMQKTLEPKEEFEVDGGSTGVSLLSNEQTLAHVLTWLKS